MAGGPTRNVFGIKRNESGSRKHNYIETANWFEFNFGQKRKNKAACGNAVPSTIEEQMSTEESKM